MVIDMHFVNLHSHSHYSSLDAVVKIDDGVNFCVENKIPAFALTEHGTLSSSFKLWQACDEKGIKPIIGIEAYFVDEIGKGEALIPGCYSHVVLLCKNARGWDNLKKLQSAAWRDGFYKKPRVDYRILQKFHKGLICSSACTGGLVGSIYLGNKFYATLEKSERLSAIHDRIDRFKNMFGDDFYLEVMLNDLDEQAELNKYVIKLSRRHAVKVIVTNDSHYIYEEDSALHDILKCIAFKKLLTDEDNGTYATKDLYFVGKKELHALRQKNHRYMQREFLADCISNVGEIVGKIKKFEIKTKEIPLPIFSKNASGKLKRLCDDGVGLGIVKKFNKEYRDRLDYELSVIDKLGMADYFLIVWDIAREARKRGIPFNTRGSVAGSLVAYLIGISWIDPIRFGTLFERFLTEDRISLPDIDMDFAKSRRGELIEYLRDKYGEDSVAHIVNFSMYKPKQAIKDVARVYNVSFAEVNRITKLIPDNTETWEEIPDNAEIAKFFENNPEVCEHAEGIIEISRHRGVHASGVVITPRNVLEWIPIAWSLQGDEDKKEKVSEYDMYDIEDLNILKLDFLGQNTLDIIQHAVELIGGKWKTFDDLCRYMLGRLGDKKVYDNICAGNLIGTFQMGTSEGMRTLIKEVQPRNIFDICACISLYRSAILAVGAHRKYIDRRNGNEEVRYLHPKMANSLERTYGIILYQEQVQQLAVELAGFTKMESDNFRKGIKQKNSDIFKKWEKKFIDGCISCSKMDEDTANDIWGEVIEWSSYGFNESHASSYAFVAFMTAWLKVYYPAQFMTALLSFNTDDDDKLSVYLRELSALKISVEMSSINKSGKKFLYDGKKVVYPITVIKNVGDKAIDNILKARKDGKFKSFEDFYDRVEKRVVNVRVMQHLILAGCFKEFGKINKVFNIFYDIRPKDKVSRTLYCLGCKYKYPVMSKEGDENVACPECGSENTITEHSLIRKKKFNLSYCKRLVYGFITDNPLKQYIGQFIDNDVVGMKEAAEQEGTILNIGGFVSNIRKYIDKNGNEMAFVALQDGENKYDLVVFSRMWEACKGILAKGGVYIFSAKVDGGKFLLNGMPIKLKAESGR